jgi:hypothetical protein
MNVRWSPSEPGTTGTVTAGTSKRHLERPEHWAARPLLGINTPPRGRAVLIPGRREPGTVVTGRSGSFRRTK